MVATFGKRLNFTKQAVVSKDYDFKNGEYGMFRQCTWRTDQTYPKGAMPSEQQHIQHFKDEFFKNDQSAIVFIKLHQEFQYSHTEKGVEYGYANVTVDECQFKGYGIAPLIILAVIIIIGLLVTAVVFMILFPGIINKAFGISPGEASAYQLAQWPILILLAVTGVIVVAALIIYWPKIKGLAQKGIGKVRGYI